MMEVIPVVLIGKHVRLEPMTETHVPGLAEVGMGQSNNSIWQFMPYGVVNTEAEMRDWVLNVLKHASDIPFVAIHLASGRVAGATRYMNIVPNDRGLEIGGTWYGLEFQRTAVNTECKYLLMSHAFEKLGAIRVQLKTDSRNERSQKAIERIGAKKEGVLRNHMILPNGYFRHSVYYSVLDSEWLEVKKNLEEIMSRWK